MADTALTIITDALLDIGVLSDEATPTASEAAGALRKLNNMIDAWNIENLMVYGSTQHILPLVADKGIYTIGVGGDLNIARPNNITSAYVRDTSQPASNQLDWPLTIYNNQDWADVAFKGLTSSWPNWGVWFDQTFPLIKAYLNPIPNSSQYSLVFWDSGILGNLLLNDLITLAPGYKRALTANLCIELAPSYGVQVSETIARVAMESKADIKIKNFQLNTLSVDPLLAGGSFNIRTGWYN